MNESAVLTHCYWFASGPASSQERLHSRVVVCEAFRQSLERGQDRLWGGVAALLPHAVHRPGVEARPSLPRVSAFLLVLLHEHHASALSAEGLTRVEGCSVGRGGVALLLAFLEGGEFSLLEAAAKTVVGGVDGVDIVADVVNVGGLGGEVVAELVPLEHAGVGLLDGRQEHLLDEGFKGTDEFTVEHRNQYIIIEPPTAQIHPSAHNIQSMAKEKFIPTKAAATTPSSFKLDIDWQAYWEWIKSAVPKVTLYPIAIVHWLLSTANAVLYGLLFVVIVGQSAHMLNASDRKFINLRHLMIKWVALLLITTVSRLARNDGIEDQVLLLVCNVFAMVMVYPSKFIKTVHLKYFSFSERKKYDDSQIQDADMLDVSVSTRLMVSSIIWLLTFSRFLITFVAPINRKRIEEAMKGLNMVIVEEKYFWKMYENQMGNEGMKNSMNLQLPDTTKIKGSLEVPTSGKSNKMISSMMRESSNIKFKADEYIEIVMPGNSGPDNRKFTFYRSVEVEYKAQTSQLLLTSEEDGKVSSHNLQELIMVEDQMVQFVFENEEEPLYLKFKTKKDCQLFLGGINLDI